jgi:acyl-homoserine lactone acylase PvdQ
VALSAQHVYARTARAPFYGDGYATGQDRLWEAEALRLTATGTVAQELGPGQRGENVQSDPASRIYSGGTRLRILYQRLPAPSRTAVQGYADGINGWISQAEAGGKLPPEYAAFGFRPWPWTTEHVLAIWMKVGGQRGAFGSDELDTLPTSRPGRPSSTLRSPRGSSPIPTGATIPVLQLPFPARLAKSPRNQ